MRIWRLCLPLFAALAVAQASLLAQQKTATLATPRLQEVARTSLMHGGCAQALFDRNQSHMLSAGLFGDLCWWDLKARKPLRHILPPGKPGTHPYLTRLQLHPSRPQATATWTTIEDPFADGAVAHNCYEVDLTTGTMVATALPEEPAERHRDLLLNNSPNGEHSVWCEGMTATGTIVRMTGERYDFAAQLGVGIRHLEIANDGTILAIDTVGQLHFQGMEAADYTLMAPHLGAAHRLVFSPDGSHVAVSGLAGMCIIDLHGEVKLSLTGTHLVEPGHDGAEFWLVSPRRAWRWNATVRREIGQPLTFPGLPLRLLRPSTEGPWAGAVRGVGLQASTRLSAAGIVNHQPWIGNASSPMRLLRWQKNGFKADAKQPYLGTAPVCIRQLPASDLVLLASMGNSDGNLLGGSQTLVFLLDEHGTPKHQWTHASSLLWVVADLQGECIWVSTARELTCLHSATLAVRSSQPLETTWIEATMWRSGLLLATDGKELQIVAPQTQQVQQRLLLPKDLTRIDVLAMSPTGKHIAVADDFDVRIFAVH
jgi:hypothetical protein